MPDTVLSKFSDTKDAYADEDLDILDELEGIWGKGNEKFPQDSHNYGQLNWDFMDREEFPYGEAEEQEQKVMVEDTTQSFFEEESYCNKVIKTENIGFWEDDEKKVSLNLNLNYEEVLDAWSDRGSLWADDYPLSMASNGHYVSITNFTFYVFPPLNFE